MVVFHLRSRDVSNPSALSDAGHRWTPAEKADLSVSPGKVIMMDCLELDEVKLTCLTAAPKSR